MYGAILGDIIGSPYEFDRGDKTKTFPLFNEESSFTDDTVMTIAVAEALLKHASCDTQKRQQALIASMKKWGKRYPDAGYGFSFNRWLKSKDCKPYGSYGNGSAMRVSSVGWLYDTLEETLEVARITAMITHNHEEGIKGAKAIAAAIYFARNGVTKDKIKTWIEREFGYDLSRSLDDIRPSFHMDETCQGTVPEAIIAFLEGTSFEDVIRNAVSLSGDADTLAAIAGSIAEAYYGIDEKLINECKNRIDARMLEILQEFEECKIEAMHIHASLDTLNSTPVKKAINNVYNNQNQESLVLLCDALIGHMVRCEKVIVPYIGNLDFLKDASIHQVYTLEDDLTFKLETFFDGKDEWIGIFTDEEECEGELASNVRIHTLLEDVFLQAMQSNYAGVVINPFSQPFSLNKELIAQILTTYHRDAKYKQLQKRAMLSMLCFYYQESQTMLPEGLFDKENSELQVLLEEWEDYDPFASDIRKEK